MGAGNPDRRNARIRRRRGGPAAVLATGLTRPDAVEVAPGLLVGSAPSPKSIRALARQGVTHVLDLRADHEGTRGDWPEGVVVRLAPIADGGVLPAAELDELVSWIDDVRTDGGRVLVHCLAGVGRSVTVALAVLVRGGIPIAKAWDQVVRARPGVAPTEAQVLALREYAALPR